MTRKDYVMIANILKNNLDIAIQNGEDTDSLKCIAYDLTEALLNDNPNFDRSRFLVACGLMEKVTL